MKFVGAVLVAYFALPTAALAELWGSDRLYEATLEACSAVTPESLKSAAMDNYRAGYFPSEKFNQLINDLTHRSFVFAMTEFQYRTKNAAVNRVLENSGYRGALEECYPADPEMRLFFDRQIQRTDSRGKIFAGALTVLVWRGTSAAITRLGQFGKLLSRAWELGAATFVGLKIYGDQTQAHARSEHYIELCGDPDTTAYHDCMGEKLVEGANRQLELLEENSVQQNEVFNRLYAQTLEEIAALQTAQAAPSLSSDAKINIEKSLAEKLKLKGDIEAFLENSQPASNAIAQDPL